MGRPKMIKPWRKKFKYQRRNIKRTETSESQKQQQKQIRWKYQLCAAYVEDALAGRLYKSGLAQNLADGRRIALWCLYITSHFTYSTTFLIVVGFHCFLSSLEPVQMVAVETNHIDRLAFWGGIVCCVIYTLDVILNIAYSRPELYFSLTHNKLYFLCIAFISIDYILVVATGRMLFRLFRSCLLIFRIQALRNTGLVMLRVTPKFLQFLIIMFAYVTVFAVMGVHLFMYTYVGNEIVESQHDGIYEGAFNNTGIAVLEIFVLMTGGSYPRFMIPAYVTHGSSVLIYFITIIMTGEIMLYALLVARIYDFYVDANIKNVKEERHRERQCLVKAFEILDTEGTGSVHYQHWKGLIKELRPKATLSEIHKRFRKLKELSDDGKSNDLTKDSFWTFTLYEIFYLPSVLQFIVEKKKARPSLVRNVWSSYPYCEAVYVCGEWITMLCQMWFHTRWAYIASLTLNVIFILPFAIVWYGMTQETSKIVYVIEMSLLVVMSLSTIMQFIALGMSFMLHEMLLHSVMLLTALVCMVYVGITNIESWSTGWLPVIAQLAMVVRLTGFKRKSSSMFHWLRRLAPALLTLLCVTCIAFYSYGVIGMESFGELDSDDILPAGISLCRHGFETLGCSLLTLFQISLGSSWHKVMHYIMNEISPWACIYFVFFYAFMQMLVLNVISAIVVELSNKIYSDESEAKQRDREYETREDIVQEMRGKIHMKSTTSSRTRHTRQHEHPSSSNSAVIKAISMTTNLMTFNSSVISKSHNDSNPHILLMQQDSQAANQKQVKTVQQNNVTLPCIVEEDLAIENVDEVTLTGRKELGKWNREILPDMTFLNANDLKRLHAEMGKSVEKLNLEKKRQENLKKKSKENLHDNMKSNKPS